MRSPDRGVLTVYADIVCPCAGLALHGLRQARERLGLTQTVRFDLRAFPLELVNSEPTPKRGIDAEVAVLGGLEPSLGWTLWHAPAETWPVTTLLALEAVQAAKRPDVGGLAASDELDAALRKAFFVESRCISLLPVVLDVAAQCPNVDVGALRKALRLGAGRAEVITQCKQADGAVQGSPHVFAEDGQDWPNPGVEFETRSGLVKIKNYDPAVYDEIVRAAGS